MFITKGKIIQMLLEQLKEKDRVIEKLANKIMAKDYREYQTFTPPEALPKLPGEAINSDEDFIGGVVDYENS